MTKYQPGGLKSRSFFAHGSWRLGAPGWAGAGLVSKAPRLAGGTVSAPHTVSALPVPGVCLCPSFLFSQGPPSEWAEDSLTAPNWVSPACSWSLGFPPSSTHSVVPGCFVRGPPCSSRDLADLPCPLCPAMPLRDSVLDRHQALGGPPLPRTAVLTISESLLPVVLLPPKHPGASYQTLLLKTPSLGLREGRAPHPLLVGAEPSEFQQLFPGPPHLQAPRSFHPLLSRRWERRAAGPVLTTSSVNPACVAHALSQMPVCWHLLPVVCEPHPKWRPKQFHFNIRLTYPQTYREHSRPRTFAHAVLFPLPLPKHPVPKPLRG